MLRKASDCGTQLTNILDRESEKIFCFLKTFALSFLCPGDRKKCWFPFLLFRITAHKIEIDLLHVVWCSAVALWVRWEGMLYHNMYICVHLPSVSPVRRADSDLSPVYLSRIECFIVHFMWPEFSFSWLYLSLHFSVCVDRFLILK